MTEQDKELVLSAIGMRKQWGKQYSNADLPVEFLDALVKYYDSVVANAVDIDAMKKLVDERDAQHEQIVLLNRQLGAAKARETLLRKGAMQQRDVEATRG